MKLEIYYDYLCPYCRKGWEHWTELLPDYPQVTPVWCPCEAHPRVSEAGYGRHSDLAIQGMLLVQEQGGDVAAYNDFIFSAAWKKSENIEDIATLVKYGVQCGADEAAFEAALRNRNYEKEQQAANTRAWGTMGLSAVPSFIAEDGQRLDAEPGVGVTKELLRGMLQKMIG